MTLIKWVPLLETIGSDVGKIEGSVKQEISTNRAEANQTAKTSREELQTSLKTFSDVISKSIKDTTDLQKNQLETFSNNLAQLTKSIEEKLGALTLAIEGKLKESQDGIATNSKDSRKELKEALDAFKNDLNLSLKDFSDRQRENFTGLIENQNTQNTAASTKLDTMRDSMEKKITQLQEGNEKKLEEMRVTVDEKLQKTLETRLTQSFELVSKNLESVQKGLGEMQQLATGVGDLKKVLSNVKTRGILGEIQLSNILEQILSPGQYDKNVITKKGSKEFVEYAIRIPVSNESDQIIYLPVDSKFPIEDYHSLLNAYELGITADIDAAGKNLENSIKKCAKDIRDKYLDPPGTTDIGIMFLPVEGLYAEVVRKSSLIEVLQRDFKIIITGPTTLAAILNSFQMGFRTISVEKRRGEIQKILGAVKTEFGKFGDVLKKAQEKINKASEDIDELVGTRTRKINSTLNNIEALPTDQSTVMMNAVENTTETIEEK